MAPAPTPVSLAAVWPAHRQVTVDLAGAGAVAGIVIGFVAFRPLSWIGLVSGVIAGTALGLFLGPRRLRLHVDEHGVEIGKLTSRRVLPWPEIVAFGIDEGPWGRSGRTLGLAVCHRGELQPVPVGTLTYTTSAFRWHGTRPEERLEVHREAALEPIRAWAEWAGLPVVDAAVDRWWDRQPDAHTDGRRAG